MSDIEIKNLIQNDSVSGPSPKVEDRINYAFMLNSSRFKIRQNSFSGFFGWMFSIKSLGVKTAIAGLLLAFVMLKPQMNMAPGSATALDTLSVNQSSVLDSTLFQTNGKTANDSIF